MKCLKLIKDSKILMFFKLLIVCGNIDIHRDITQLGFIMKTFYFTGTGNSLHVAKEIGGELLSIPKMLKENNFEFEDDAIGFVFPCYCFGLPRMVIEFLKKSKFKAKYFFAIMTYGMEAASGLSHIEEMGRKIGIAFNYTNEILMIDNYLPLFDIDNQLNIEENKNIEKNLKYIVNDIAIKKNRLTRKGIVSIIMSKIVYTAYKFMYDNNDKQFIVNDNCKGCKICEKVCPKDNIIFESNRPKFLHKCDSCLACIHHCSKTAIHLKNEKSPTRFINKKVTLEEIIDANN